MSKEYDVNQLRRPQAVADLGRETSSLYHNFGTDLTRKNNLCLIESGVIMYVVGNTVVIHELSTGITKTILGLDDGGVGCVAVHPSKKMFAVGGRGFQPNIYIYSYPELVILNVLKGGAERGYSCLAYNAHGTKLASVATSPDYMLTVWDWQQEIIELHSKAFGQEVFGVKFSKDEEARLTTCGTGHIRFWKMAATFTGLKLQGYIGKFGKVELTDVTAMDELPDGKVVSGTESGALLLWEGNFIKCRFVQVGGKPCHIGNVTYVELDRTEKCLVTAAEDGYIRWWDFSAIDSAEVDTDITMDFELFCVAEFKVDNNTKIRSMLDCGGTDISRNFVINDSSGRTLLVKIPLLEPLRDYGVGEDRLSLLSKGAFKGSVSRSVMKLGEFSNDAKAYASYAGVPQVTVVSEYHSGRITGLDVSPESHLAASCGVDGTVRVWDYVNKKLMCSRNFDAPATSLTWVPTALNHLNDKDARHVLVGFADGMARVLFLGVGDDNEPVLRQKFVFKPHNTAILDLKFSEDAAMLCTSSKDGTIFLLKTSKISAQYGKNVWNPVRMMTVQPGGNPKAPTCADSLSWKSDGNAILLSCSDGILREVNVSTAYAMQDDCDTYEYAFPTKEFCGQVIKERDAKKQDAKAAEGTEADGASTGTGTAPSSPSKSESMESLVQYSSVKVNRAIYKTGEASILTGVTSSALRMHLLEFGNVEGGAIPQDPNADYALGLYSFDGKAQLKAPLPTTIQYTCSKQFIGVGNADGTVCIRPAKYPATFLRMAAHNGAVTFACASYDNKFVISAGLDGIISVHVLDLDLINSAAESLWKDLDAGVYGTSALKPDLKKDKLASSVVGELSPRSKTLPSLAKAIEDANDMEKGAYSIQDAKLKSEEDAKIQIAEQVKDQQRALVRALQKEYEQIVEANNALPPAVRLSEEQMTIDVEQFALLRRAGESLVEEVHKECKREAERAAKLRDKLVNLQDSMLVQEITLKAFHTGVGRSAKNFVRSIRTMGLPPALILLIESAQQTIKDAVVNENSSKLQDSGPIREIHAVDMQNVLEDKASSIASKSGTKEAEVQHHHGGSAAARREARRIRKENILKHKKEEPKDDEDDERDVQAISLAERTIGDYKLKVAPDYVVPADQHVVASKKKLQMAMLEESMVKMRLEFNERFLALRDLKKELIYAIKRANSRIRGIDSELQQEHMSANLWEPSIDPSEYPEDRDRVQETELQIFEAARNKTMGQKGGWLKTLSVDHVSVDVDKQRLINKNYATGEFLISAIAPEPASYTDLNISLVDTSSMKTVPESMEAPKVYQINDSPLQIYVQESDANAISRAKYIESAVPALAKIQQVKRAVTRSDAVQDVVRQERRRRLRVEREWLVKTIAINVSAFAEAIEGTRLDRTTCMTDLKLAELKLLVLFQEFTILQGFEARDNMLLDKLSRSKKELASIELEVSELQTTLESKEQEKKALVEETATIANDFATLLPASYPYYEQLRRIYKMKIKRGQSAEDGEEEEEEQEAEDDDEEGEEDLDEVDDACPPGCDPGMYERVVEARDRKLGNDEACAALQKLIDETKRAYERLKTRLKQVSKDVKQSGTEIQAFQLQKQSSLNQIDVNIPLSLKQIYMFQASGVLTGPDKDKSAEADATNQSPESGAEEEKKESVAAEDDAAVDLTLLSDANKRTLMSNLGSRDYCIVQADVLKGLRARIGGLRKETDEARKQYGELRKERVVLSKLRDAQQEKISQWKAKARDLQMLKFGREIDLDDLEAGSNRSREDEAEHSLTEQEKAFSDIIRKLTKEGEALREKLAGIMVKNTDLLKKVGECTEEKLTITRDLNKPGNNVSTESKDEGRQEREERQKVIAYVQLQAREIEALRAELIMLKRKEAPQLSQIVGQQSLAQPPGAPTSGIASQSKTYEGQLPPIPNKGSIARANQK